LAGSAVVHLKSQNTKKGQNIQSVPPGRANKSFKPTALRATIGIGGVATSSAFLTAAVLGRGLTPALALYEFKTSKDRICAFSVLTTNRCTDCRGSGTQSRLKLALLECQFSFDWALDHRFGRPLTLKIQIR
jgi:hypothetical protein